MIKCTNVSPLFFINTDKIQIFKFIFSIFWANCWLTVLLDPLYSDRISVLLLRYAAQGQAARIQTMHKQEVLNYCCIPGSVLTCTWTTLRCSLSYGLINWEAGFTEFISSQEHPARITCNGCSLFQDMKLLLIQHLVQCLSWWRRADSRSSGSYLCPGRHLESWSPSGCWFQSCSWGQWLAASASDGERDLGEEQITNTVNG